ncbi:serine/threonine-protein kinase STN7, chloroplastic isoform X2 [Amborella trichopoda]|uniref:serine/threonine-protein kinase STN7, chloroplastic isoform X2 n=1 Tax=Amborella trichopoda TaxID=13333 RepID=UPI0005D2DAAE|nr:serine/threonine-protein kinase STN7, chloroplastic isoform X2 [Amborella trichopoda]|eukprot:XP_011623109.1 serine/threonine-protein kinase STN7, chloroplastic isoform X2 [Amborella trichopoda]
MAAVAEGLLCLPRLRAAGGSKKYGPSENPRLLGRKPWLEREREDCRGRKGKRRLGVRAGWGEMVQNLVLGVGVGLPCTVMECGDIIYRSTLPRSNGLNVTAPGVALALGAISYLWATPGVAPGFFDMFVLAFVERLFRPTYRKDDFVLGKKLGEGAFGVVYKVSPAKKGPGMDGDLVLKKATEYGAVEIWMNERVRRACANSCADFVYGFLESSSKGKGGAYWLIWRYEGEATLADLMLSKEFPYNVERMILGEDQGLEKGLERENKIIQTIIGQVLFALDGLHSTGIVHRDIKPQNIIFSEEDRIFKIIDLGAAADLRVGINYIPKEFLLDPRYAAPEQYIMSTQTPSAPSAPVATALSPVLWQVDSLKTFTSLLFTCNISGKLELNLPDRFDIYSTGLIFLQMAFPSLRTDSSLIQFNRQLKRCGYDLVEWRKTMEPRASPELRRGFELLDLDGGIGWELLLSMVRYKARRRTSAKAALAHPYFDREGLQRLSFMQNLRLQLFRATQQDYSEAATWVIGLMAKSGTKKEGGFTEAQLLELRELQPKKKANVQRNVLASLLKLQRKIVRTINESMDELNQRRKSFWWSRWIPREE